MWVGIGFVGGSQGVELGEHWTLRARNLLGSAPVEAWRGVLSAPREALGLKTRGALKASGRAQNAEGRNLFGSAPAASRPPGARLKSHSAGGRDREREGLRNTETDRQRQRGT